MAPPNFAFPMLAIALASSAIITACGSDTTSTPSDAGGDVSDSVLDAPPPADGGPDVEAAEATKDTLGSDDAADSPGRTDADAASPSDGGDRVDAPDAPDAPCASCVAAKVAWERNGGEALYYDHISISPCRSYTRVRDGRGDPAPITCTVDIAACGTGDALDMGDVLAALAHPDVVGALAKAPILYGIDSRPSDGTVFRLDVGDRRIEVGSDCMGAAGCTPTPAGVTAAVDLLRRLDRQTRDAGPCKGKFPGA